MANLSLAELRSILSSRSEANAAIEQLFPNTELIDFLGALQKTASDRATVTSNPAHEIDSLLSQLETVQQLGQSPLIAVSGLLNAGKSSLIASFLSPENRGRVLVGTGNQQGTHRFVIWLPSSWQQQTLIWQRWLDQLSLAFGKPAEWLSQDPATAFAQYNGQSFSEYSTYPTNTGGVESVNRDLGSSNETLRTLEIPLLATDAGLDQLGVGLIECPDIQTGILGSSSSTPWEDSDIPEYRRKLLSQAAKLCSAFIVVTKLRDLHDRQTERLLSTLKDAMPGLPRILAVNLVRRRYSPSEIMAESHSLMSRYEIDRLYAAYDYRGDQLRERLPPIPEEFATQSIRGESTHHPIFFRLDRAPLNDSAPRPAPEDYLIRLGRQLNQSEMVLAWRMSLAQQLQQQILLGKEHLLQRIKIQHNVLSEVRQEIAAGLLTLIAIRDEQGEANEIRLQTSKQIIGQINASLHRTAPWWAWPSLMVDRTVAWTKESVSAAAKSLMPISSVQQSLKGVKDWFRQSDRSQVLTADRLRKELRTRLSDHLGREWNDEKWLQICQEILDRFQSENQTLLPATQLDHWASNIWQNMPWSKRLTTGLVPVASVFAPLAAVILIPFDFGGSTVLVFASLKELVAAAGIAGAWAAFSGNPTPAVAEQEAAWQQYGDLVAITLDAFGIPRPSTEPETPRVRLARSNRKLPSSTLKTRTKLETHPQPIWQIRTEFLKQLERFKDLPTLIITSHSNNHR